MYNEQVSKNTMKNNKRRKIRLKNVLCSLEIVIIFEFYFKNKSLIVKN